VRGTGDRPRPTSTPPWTTEAHVNVAATTPVASPSPARSTTTQTTASTIVNEVVRVDGDGAVAGDGIVLGVVGGDVDVGLGRSASPPAAAARYCPGARIL
jgi:hypothetical protein